MGGWPDGPPGCKPGLLAGLALAAGLLAGAAVAQPVPDCPEPRLTVTAEDGRIGAVIEAPCAPYAEVGLGLGVLAITEETGIDGRLAVSLPVLSGAAELTARIGRQVLRAPLPAADPAPFLAILWPETGAWGRLAADGADPRRLGFPRPGAAFVDLLEWPATASPAARLDVPVTEAACGRRQTASVVTADSPEPRPVSVTMPDCAAVGQRVVIPLGP